ncbi:MAG: hypothetical protein R3E57_05705 [Porticoccaceae bacterium]
MKKYKLIPRITFLLFCFPMMALTGCGSSLPKGEAKTQSQWQTFEEAKVAYDNIVLHETTTADLRELGFDPYSAPNVRILSYLDIIRAFSPNDSVKPDDLPPSVRACIKAREECLAYEATPSVSSSKRVGNVVLDLLKFKRERIRTGWNFNALVVIDHDIVVYKIWSGMPIIDEMETRKNPLGPIQDSIGSAVQSGAGM